MREKDYPIRHPNNILEGTSETYFRTQLSPEWLIEKPIDFGIDFIVTPVVNNQVLGLSFSVQLKAQRAAGNKPEVRLKKSTLNYLFTRLEPAMVVLYDDATKQAFWKWILPGDFDLNKPVASFPVLFNVQQTLAEINWEEVLAFTQRIFKTKNHLLSALEYDLFQNASDQEQKAWSHYFLRQLTEASFYFTRLVKQERPRSVWYLALAQCQYQMYDYKNALHNINRAMEIEANDNYRLTKGCILAEDGIRNNDRRKLVEAEVIFDDLYTRHPTDVNAYNYANTLSKLGHPQRAEELYKEALQINPSYAEAWKNLGQLYYDLRRHEEEMDCYNKALAIKPNLMEAKVSKAITSGFVYKRYASAVKVLTASIDTVDKLATEFPLVYYWLGFFYQQLGKLNEALQWIGRGLNNNPGDIWLINLKANILFSSLDTQPELRDDAISFFSNNFRVNKRDSLNLYCLCSALEKAGRCEEALAMAKTWLTDQPVIQVGTAAIRGKLLFADLTVLIRHWDLVESYGIHYSIEKVCLAMDECGLRNHKTFLQWFDVKRSLFVASLSELLCTRGASVKKTEIKALYKVCFFSIEPAAIGQLIQVSKDDLHKFAEQFSSVTVTLNELFIVEFVRCLGFIVGHRKRENERVLLKHPMNKALYTDTLLYITELLYEHFDLP